jgi:hypothetical protein
MVWTEVVQTFWSAVIVAMSAGLVANIFIYRLFTPFWGHHEESHLG